MKISPSPKRRILIKSLRKQLSLMLQNLDEFGLQPQQMHGFMIEVIFFNQAHQNPEDNHQKRSKSVQKPKTIKQNLSIGNLVDLIIDEVESRQISDKSLIKCLHNVYAQNSSLTAQSYVSFAPAIQIKHETQHKLPESINRISSKYEKFTSNQRKNTYEDTLYRRRSQFFERDSIFKRRQEPYHNDESYENDEYYDEDEALEYESSRMSSRVDPLGLMQQEVARLKEIQRKYQQELEEKIGEKRKMLDRLKNSPIPSVHPPEFSSIYSRDMQY